MDDPGRLIEVLAEGECLEQLRRARVGRVVFTVGALPAIVPVTFALTEDAVVLRTAATTELARAADDGVLAFEIDDVDPVTRTGWSVVVTGIAEIVTAPVERARIEALVTPWAPGGRDVCVRLPLTRLTGRRIVAVRQLDADAS